MKKYFKELLFAIRYHLAEQKYFVAKLLYLEQPEKYLAGYSTAAVNLIGYLDKMSTEGYGIVPNEETIEDLGKHVTMHITNDSKKKNLNVLVEYIKDMENNNKTTYANMVAVTHGKEIAITLYG